MNAPTLIHTCEQRSPEWYALRLGRLTSSCAADMMTTRRDKQEAAGRRNLRVRLMLERVTGRSQESNFQTDAMRIGAEREADARGLYEALTGALLTTVGFVSHPTLLAGASPDGLVDYEGLVECKCPLPATHWEYLRTGIVPDEYQKQVVHQLWVVGVACSQLGLPVPQWCDWISYHPEFPESLQLKMVRIVRDQAAIDAYELMARNFLAEVDAEVEAVDKLALAVA